MKDENGERIQWRPTDEQMIEIKALSGVGLNEEQVADYLGISRSTFQLAMKKDDTLRQAVLRARSNALGNVAKTAYEMAMSKTMPNMTQFYLKCRGGWKYTTVIEHEGLKQNDEEKLTQVLEEVKGLLGGKNELGKEIEGLGAALAASGVAEDKAGDIPQ